tara:strand:- start:1546 stop:1950 length:405 start_codon:yes stop_codon:yes gene_type:complete
MGLFGSKKKEDKLPPLEFPELPKSIPTFEGQKQEMPAEAAEIKQAVSQPPAMNAAPQMPVSSAGPEQPLFVKIEKYRSVMDNLGKLKKRLSEAEGVLAKMNKLKEEEDRELEIWHADLEKIRTQLLNIDRNLFE